MRYWKLLMIVFLLPLSLGAQLLSPEEYFSDYATAFRPHHRVIDYVRQVAEESPRVLWREYGQSEQGRPLGVAIISSPENIDRWKEIRDRHITALMDPDPPADDNRPVIVWLSHGVHGNEPAATESALINLYKLAEAKGYGLDTGLDNTIIILDPCLNPDGFDRYVHFYRSVKAQYPQIHRATTEHQEPWPHGRVNHYHFDLNRDWLWQTQKESRHRLAEFLDWRPHVHVDFHEMYPGSNYFFPPATQPYLGEIQDWQVDMQRAFGEHNAKYFDKKQWLYYTDRDFDLFYPSYGDTYPMLSGSIGMTYEQEGHRLAGLAFLKENGDTLRLADRIAHHHQSAMATVEKAIELRKPLLRNQRSFYHSRSSSSEVFLWTADSDAIALRSELIHLLKSNRIPFQVVQQARKPGQKNAIRATHMHRQTEEQVHLESGDIVIRVKDSHPLSQILFSGQHSERTEQALQNHPVGDVTCWSAAYFIGGLYRSDASALRAYELASYSPSAENEALDISETPPYAYALPLRDLEFYDLLAQLLKHEIRLRVGQEDWTSTGENGDSFPAGSIVVLASENSHGQMHKAQSILGASGIAVHSGLTGEGPNLGYSSFRLLTRPRIALLRDETFDPNAYGHHWHFLDQQLPEFYHNISPEEFWQHSSSYNVVVVPGGKKSWTNEEMESLSDFVKKGSQMIVVGQSVEAFGDSEFWKIQNKPYPDSMSKTQTKSGAVLPLDWNTDHYSSYGFPETYYSLGQGHKLLQLDTELILGGIDQEVTASCGYLSDGFKQYAANSMSFARESVGSGEAIFMVDDPLYRGFWSRGHQLMYNLLLFSTKN